MEWRKLGLVFSHNERYEWMNTHAASPVALQLRQDLYRVYFASRDALNRSHLGFVEFNVNAPQEILCVASEPVLAPGSLGHFDDHGVYAASLVQYQGVIYLYYIGWNPGIKPPLFYSSIGLAVSVDGGESFSKTSVAPIMARSEHDPCLVTSPCVMIDGNKWRMWYVSGFKWEQIADGLQSYYHIKYAESDDGVTWNREGLICIDHQIGERNIARPCVIKENETYKMWFSYNKGEGYRIGYAESPDGYGWTRKDAEVEIALSDTGWDSEAMAYPWVFSAQDKKYMLYNGNGFGRGGFGLAVED